MASLADVFKDQERTNWLKAWLAIDIAKSGLEHLADNEAQNFHTHIYSQVGSTCNSCSTTNLLHRKQCQKKICDKVCQEIIKEHRYNSWSWKNTSAQLWQTNYWEIAKCYFPPDGYAATRSMQDTDFNGVVSFMLNCTRFDSKFSFPITTGKPTHNAACLLYKAREIVKSVRHSSIMKVTDVDLQNYFTTFTSLLSDSQYLSQDSDAQNAVKILAQLEKDTLLLTTMEMMCSLAAVSTFLKQQLRDVAKDAVDASVNDLRVNTTLCIGSIKVYLVKCKKDFNENADKLTQAFDENADKHMQAFYENADKHMQSFDENADKHTQSFDENADKRTQALDENAEKHTQDYNELTAIRTRKFDEHADKRTQEYDELTDIRKKDFDENADKRLRAINELFENTIFTETFYKQSCEELLRAMMKHYAKILSHVTTSPLNDWVQARLDDIYMSPDLQLMKKTRGPL